MSQIRTYREFWPYYLREHAHPATRLVHIAGTVTALALFAAAILAARPGLGVAALLAGYVPAWVTHLLVEKNRPATFRYPMWSLASDLKMSAAWLAGNLEHELEKAGLGHKPGERS